MLIHLTIAFSAERVELKVDRPHIHRVDANLVALEPIPSNAKRGRKLLEIGEATARLGDDAIVKPIYDPDAFEPELTAAGVGYYRNLLFQEARPRLIEMFTVGFLDRFQIDLLLPQFERLPAVERDRFAQALGIVWTRSDVHVNHQRLPRPK